MKLGIGLVMILVGLYFFWPAIAISHVFGALLIGGGALALRSKITGKPMLGGASQRLLRD